MFSSNSNRIFSNYFLVVVSISSVLFFLSAFIFFVLNSNKIIDDFKEKIPIVVFIKDEASKIELSQFEKKLSIDNSVKRFVYTSKDDAATKFSSEIGENFVEYLGHNPLLNSIDVYFHADKVETLFINDIVENFQKEDFVYEVSYDAPLIFLINDNFKKVKDWVLVLALFFIFISIILINNTIRLSIYSKRMTIKTMQLVGATKSFIKKPFIFTQIKLGFFSAFISSIFFISLIIYFNSNYFNIDLIIIKNSIIISVATSFALSFLISSISTNFITARFLNSKIDKLY
ncbi:MAG: cell division protein FtsX [Flavobacteriales bacterium]|nr:cell division protein FtsX [Flavobacteriales bacterium]